MDNTIKISVADDFTKKPGLRHEHESPKKSGQLFRETILGPAFERAIKEDKDIEIDLDRTVGYGTSFLEEAFGGLVRNNSQKKDIEKNIKHKLKFISMDDRYLIEEINGYIEDAIEKI